MEEKRETEGGVLRMVEKIEVPGRPRAWGEIVTQDL